MSNATSVRIGHSDRRKAIAAGAIGNVIEWFDFIVYGSLAAILAPLFFPSHSSTASLLAAFSTFAVAFLFRPIGGFMFGHIGDRRGRRAALSGAVLLMSAATVVIGLLPTAESIGVAAAILMVTARCVQGFAAGAEWSGSAIYLVEYGDKRRRGLFASLTPAGAWIGSAAGVAVVSALTAMFGSAAMEEWGWRVPFLIAGPLGLVGLYLRIRLNDTPEFERLKSKNDVQRAPIREALRKHKKALLVIFVGAVTQGSSTYLMTAFMVSYLTTNLGVALGVALLTNTVALCVGGVAAVAAGRLSDRIGRKTTFVGAVAMLLVIGVPLFLLIGRGDVVALLIGQFILATLIACMHAPLAALCVELFPAEVRYAASGVSYALGAMIAGTSPLISSALIAATGLELSPAFYMSFLLLIALIVLSRMLHETAPGRRRTRPATAAPRERKAAV